MDEFALYKALLIGASIAGFSLVLIGIYAKLQIPILQWIANLRMKSLFRKDRRKRVRKFRR